MRIDPSIHHAIGDGTLTIERVLEAMMQVVLEHVAADCIARGFAPSEVKCEIEKLRKTRPDQLETVRQMLLESATSLQ